MGSGAYLFPVKIGTVLYFFLSSTGRLVPVKETPVDIRKHSVGKTSEPRICLDSICYTVWKVTVFSTYDPPRGGL